LRTDALPGLVAIVALTACAGALASPHPSVRVALAQIRIEDGDLEGNMRRAEEAIRQAARQKADLICLAEAADFGWLYQESRKVALPIPGRYSRLLCGLAKDLKVWISAGCLERDGETVYNSAVLINRRGKIILKHRKINTMPEATAHLYDAGKIDDITTADTEFGRVGITICADNFDSKIPKRVADLGAWLLISPHGWAPRFGEFASSAQSYQEHVRGLAQGNKLWVVAVDASMGRTHGGVWPDRFHIGCSMVANPKGEPMAIAKTLAPDLVIYQIPAEQ